MKRALRQFGAIVFGVMLITAGALGAAFTNPNVDSLDDAANQYVEGAEGQALIAAGIYVGAAGYMAYEEYIDNDPKTEELKKADALETKKEIYDSASTQKQNNQITQTAYNNYLNDTSSIALMEGKNAYIRALENGSAESVARNKVTEAVADYYAVKQKNLIAAWDTTLTVYNSSLFTAENTSGLSAGSRPAGGYLYPTYVAPSNARGSVYIHPTLTGLRNQSVTLVNSTTEDVLAYRLDNVKWTDGSFGSEYDTGATLTINGGSQVVDSEWGPETVDGLTVSNATKNFDSFQVLNVTDFSKWWQEIETQNNEVQSQVDTFIDNTYANYQQGEINSSDLVDPYLGAREYSPETSATWGLRSLSAMGLDSPENVSSIGEMEIVSGSVTYHGVLMTDTTPSGGFVVGNTYNATALNGSQFIALSSGGVHQLEGEFTLKSAERTDGSEIGQNESVTYQDITYETANTTEYQALQEQLNNLTAKINGRQQRLRQSGGGAWLPDIGIGGLGPLGTLAGFGTVTILLGGAALVLVGRNR